MSDWVKNTLTITVERNLLPFEVIEYIDSSIRNSDVGVDSYMDAWDKKENETTVVFHSRYVAPGKWFEDLTERFPDMTIEMVSWDEVRGIVYDSRSGLDRSTGVKGIIPKIVYALTGRWIVTLPSRKKRRKKHSSD